MNEEKKDEFMKKIGNNIIKLLRENKIITEKFLPERMNSYERSYLMPYWDNELLIKNVKYYILQASSEFRKTPYYEIDGTYNKTLKHKLIHLLLERLEREIK